MHLPANWQDLSIKAAMYFLPLSVLILGIMLLSGNISALRAMRWMIGKRKAAQKFESLPIAQQRRSFLILGWGFVFFSTFFLFLLTRAFIRTN